MTGALRRGGAGVAAGLLVATWRDWPPGPTIVWTMALLGALVDATIAARVGGA